MPGTSLRLPPQPTNTRVARCAAGVVEIAALLFSLLPGATVRQRRRMELQIRLQRDEINQRGVMIFQLQHDIRDLEKAYHHLMRGVGLPEMEIGAGMVEDFAARSPTCRITTHYEPIHFQFLTAPDDRDLMDRGELPPRAQEALRRAAKAIASHHAEAHAAKILEITLDTLTRKGRARA